MQQLDLSKNNTIKRCKNCKWVKPNRSPVVKYVASFVSENRKIKIKICVASWTPILFFFSHTLEVRQCPVPELLSSETPRPKRKLAPFLSLFPESRTWENFSQAPHLAKSSLNQEFCSVVVPLWIFVVWGKAKSRFHTQQVSQKQSHNILHWNLANWCCTCGLGKHLDKDFTGRFLLLPNNHLLLNCQQASAWMLFDKRLVKLGGTVDIVNVTPPFSHGGWGLCVQVGHRRSRRVRNAIWGSDGSKWDKMLGLRVLQ